jgi:hypothetical protein
MMIEITGSNVLIILKYKDHPTLANTTALLLDQMSFI